MPLTEDQIERRVEKVTDYLDRCLMKGIFDQKTYDSNIADLSKWADAKNDERLALERAKSRGHLS